jgi:hypothetical protein
MLSTWYALPRCFVPLLLLFVLVAVPRTSSAQYMYLDVDTSAWI